MKDTGYDEGALESCGWGGLWLGAQSTGGRGLRTLVLVSSAYKLETYGLSICSGFVKSILLLPIIFLNLVI